MVPIPEKIKPYFLSDEQLEKEHESNRETIAKIISEKDDNLVPMLFITYVNMNSHGQFIEGKHACLMALAINMDSQEEKIKTMRGIGAKFHHEQKAPLVASLSCECWFGTGKTEEEAQESKNSHLNEGIIVYTMQAGQQGISSLLRVQRDVNNMIVPGNDDWITNKDPSEKTHISLLDQLWLGWLAGGKDFPNMQEIKLDNV